MLRLLAKIFIRNHQDYNNNKVRVAYGKLSSAVGIISNIFLCAVKIITGILTSSIAITADGINNLSDAGSSIITLIGFKLSSMPADNEHPYGHQRIEYITGLLVSFIILVIGLLLAKSSIEKIITPTYEELELKTQLIMIGILVLSIAVKLWRVFLSESGEIDRLNNLNCDINR